jgi:superfamily II DNA or RNA helicase
MRSSPDAGSQRQMRGEFTRPTGQLLPPSTRKVVAREIALLLRRDSSLSGKKLQEALKQRGVMHGSHKISRGNISSILRELKSSRTEMPSRSTSGASDTPVTRRKSAVRGRNAAPRDITPLRARKVAHTRTVAVGAKPESAMYPWQAAALTAWQKAGRRGVVQAITGSGKTRVGLEAASAAVANGQGVVVVVPTKLLQAQWINVAAWLPQSSRPESGHLCVATASMACKDAFWNASRTSKSRLLIIVDEVHRVGSTIWSNALVPHAIDRLGLTATLERSDGGVETHIAPYFELKVGKNGATPTFDLDYKRARKERTISRYQVIFVPCAFSDKEYATYQQLRSEYSNSWAKLHEMTEGPGRPPRKASATQKLKWALRYSQGKAGPVRSAARSVIKSFNGLNVLMSNMAAKQGFVAALANSGALTGNPTILFAHQIETMKAIGVHLKRAKVEAVAISGDSSDDERGEAVQLFHDGKVDVFSSPRVADEGLNLPTASLAISIASVKSRRHLIQRLGRVIRPKENDALATMLVLYASGTLEDPAEGGAADFRQLASQGGQVVVIPARTSAPSVLKHVLRYLETTR